MGILATVLTIVAAGPVVVPPPSAPAVDALALQWTAPAQCPGADEIRGRVHDRLPRGLASPVEVRASVTAIAEGYEVSLVVSVAGMHEERRFASPDCDLLGDAVALVVAVTADPLGVAVGLDSPRADESRAPADDAPIPSVPPAPKARADETDASATSSRRESPGSGDADPRPSTGTDLAVGVRARAGGGLGPTRGAHGVVGGGVALIGRSWRADLVGAWAIPRVVVREDDTGGTFTGWWLAPRGCWVPRIAARLELSACAGVELGQVRARGLDSLPRVSRASSLWVAPVVAPGLAWMPTPWLAIGLELDIAVPAKRVRFIVDDGATPRAVERLTPVALRPMLGIELRLPRVSSDPRRARGVRLTAATLHRLQRNGAQRVVRRV